MNPVFVEKEIAGRTIRIETGKIAKQTNGAVIVSAGKSVVLCCAVEGTPREGIDFFPLMCDYREKMYASGKIPGSFMRREARPGTRETLISRMIDRPVRPNFPKGFKNEVQVDCTVLSFDPDNDTDILAMIGASAALGISDIPFETVLGAIRIGYINDELIVYPNAEQFENSRLDLTVSGSKDAIMMVESCADILPEETMLNALDLAHSVIKDIVELQEELIAKAGKPKKEFVAPAGSGDLFDKMKADLDKLIEAFKVPVKQERGAKVSEIKAELEAKFLGDLSEDEQKQAKADFKNAFDELKTLAMRELIHSGTRCDGRGLTDVRPISSEVAFLPNVHGSALFTRGETQAIVTCTLGTTKDGQLIDDLGPKRSDTFLLHYNFPPYSVGETGPKLSAGRREIGHGNLAMRALKAVLPGLDDFPYTTRIVSEITESNGSSSMASVCGGSLSLMDAGVPVKAPVAGIAMGLIKDGDREAIITDILGDEDHYGDMDFKVAGTSDGVTALQMDIKIKGLSRDTMKKALEQAREGRLHILGEMAKTLEASKPDLAASAPKITQIKIDPEFIGKIIGPGGAMIRAIQEDTETDLTIEDDGTVLIYAPNTAASEKAIAKINSLTAKPEVGRTYHGKVVGVKEFGAFVEVMDGVSGLLHISEISDDFVKDINTVVQLGDEIDVVISAIDKTGKLRLVRDEKYRRQQENKDAEG